MTQRPILFSTPMVQAILEGRKTQTRRVVEPQPEIGEAVYDGTSDLSDNQTTEIHHFLEHTDGGMPTERYYNLGKCPYGKPGDVLWVRETWQPSASGAYVHFKADIIGVDAGKGWNPSIHMPKDACRVFLRITNVRVERLQEISEKEAISEGVNYKYDEEEGYHYLNYAPKPNGNRKINTRFSNSGWFKSSIDSFKSLWYSINGEQSWNDNPWVWVLEFERMEGRP